MKINRWYLWLALLLAAASAGFYALQITLFHKPGDTYFYLLQDLAFLPIQVLLVTLFLNELLSQRERQQRRRQMNMVIGAFFSEAGGDLMAHLSRFDPQFASLKEDLAPNPSWGREDFRKAERSLARRRFGLDSRRGDLHELKDFLLQKRSFILSLLENQNLLEHQNFTDLLWAMTHLTEELHYRPSLVTLPDSDHQHLSGDLNRIYSLLLRQWLRYAAHLEESYPYMYSLLLRRNPFHPESDPTIR
jgi:hypothetical protein